MDYKTSSEETAKISDALSKVQGEMGKALKDSTNPFFKSKYADLSSVVDACQKHFTENCLSFSSCTIYSDSQYFLIGTLRHSSGEWLKTMVPLLSPKMDMQSYGSACTYARRYALMCLCNIVTEDDDGESAIQRMTQSQLEIMENILKVLNESGLREKILNHHKVRELKELNINQFDSTMKTLTSKLEAKRESENA